MNRRTGKKINKWLSFRLLSVVLVITALTLPTYSFLVKYEEVTNRFSSPEFDIELIEENYDRLTEEQKSSLVPNKQLDKDPKVKNIEETDAFVFLKVTVPVAEITEADTNTAYTGNFSLQRDFAYTNTVERFTAPRAGYYKLEAWGAQGGSALHSENTVYGDESGKVDGGKGGYSYGTVHLEEGQTIYVCVGGEGASIRARDVLSSNKEVNKYIGGGYNGGGDAHILHYNEQFYVGAGGGATHFALKTSDTKGYPSEGTLSSYKNNKNSILLVAGGGGGSYYLYRKNGSSADDNYYGHGGYGGGVNGGNGVIDYTTTSVHSTSLAIPGGTQTDQTASNNNTVRYGSFGQGVGGIYTESSTEIQFYDSGAGGGWYGGGKTNYGLVGGGGSGHIGTGVISGETIGGNQNFYTPEGTEETGHTGDGYARITYINSISYPYSEKVESFTALESGDYKLEAWGAQGGSANQKYDLNDTRSYEGGKGGYSYGTVHLNAGDTIYICVGGQGTSFASSPPYDTGTTAQGKLISGGYNGGGSAYVYNRTHYYAGSGGGATHFAYALSGSSGGTLKQYSSTANQSKVILVAGGGGGSYFLHYAYSSTAVSDHRSAGGYGGGETGGNGIIYQTANSAFANATIPGGKQTPQTSTSSVFYGSFGQGVNATGDSNTSTPRDSGAGGGWYGGGKIVSLCGGGGSGHYNSDLLETDYGYATIAGNVNFTSPSGQTETGHSGNGFAKITFVRSDNQQNTAVTNTKERKEIFLLKTEGASAYDTDNSFHTVPAYALDREYWIELPEFEEGTDCSGNTRTYVFGYSVYLRTDEQTKTLFDIIQLKNILQYEVEPFKDIAVNVQAFGIQADHIDGIEKDDEDEKRLLTAEELKTIYSYIDK